MFHSFWYGLLDFFGIRNESGPGYGFWSGFAGDLSIIGAAVIGVRHLNCHTPGCWRLGKHTTVDGYKLCRHCIGKSKAELGLHEIHEDHQ